MIGPRLGLCPAADDAIVVYGRIGEPALASERSDDGKTARHEMSNDLDNVGEGREVVTQKLDTLSASVDDRFAALAASLDERFDAVDVALVEQRQYTEFAFNAVDRRFDAVERRFDAAERRFDAVEGRFDTVDSRFDTLERKLDQLIDTQSATNKLVERRLTALEPRSAHE